MLQGRDKETSNGLTITRNAGATWFLTSEDEWYKAAYYQPAAQGGDSDNYWAYPTATNGISTVATADAVGNINNPGPHVMNFKLGADWNGENGNVTTVGSAGPLSNSFYGTADQGGNVFEWNESPIGFDRGARGGAWYIDSTPTEAKNRNSALPSLRSSAVGFRVATVPEPSTYALAAIGVVGLLAVMRRQALT